MLGRIERVDLATGRWSAWRIMQSVCQALPQINRFDVQTTYTTNTALACKLKNPLIIRPRAHYPDEKRYGVMTDIIGVGATGWVGCMTEFSLEEQVPVRLSTPRVVKVQRKLDKEDVEAEKELTPDYLGWKPWIESGSALYTVMRQMPGASIDKLLQLKRIQQLMPYQLVTLFIKMVRQLQSQVHEQEKVHRDIKSANFVVDLSDPDHPVVNLVDFGLAKSITKKDNDICVGTPLYMSYEALFGRGTTYESDIWGLGVLFLEMLGVRPEEKLLYIRAQDFPVPIILPMLGRAPQWVSEAMQRLIHGMTRNNQQAATRRSTAVQVEDQLQEIRLSLKREHLKLDEMDFAMLVAAHQLAVNARKALKKKNILLVKQVLADALADLPDSPHALVEFIEALDIVALRGCQQKTDVLHLLEGEIAHFTMLRQQLQLKLDKTLALKQSQPTFFPKDNLDALVDKQIRLLNRKIEKYSVPIFDLDELLHKNKKGQLLLSRVRNAEQMQIYLQCQAIRQCLFQQVEREVPIVNRLNRLLSALEDRVIVSVADDQHTSAINHLVFLKYQFKIALSQYLRSIVEKNKRHLFDANLSLDQLDKVKAILKVIQQAPDRQTLLEVMREQSDALKPGFFGRNDLKDCLEAVLTTEQQYERGMAHHQPGL